MRKVTGMTTRAVADPIDARLLMALRMDPRATTIALAEQIRGVGRTRTSLVMRGLVDYRLEQLTGG